MNKMKGYFLDLTKLNEQEVRKIQSELTVKPIVHQNYDFGQIKPFQLFRIEQGTKYVFVPKYYKHNGILHTPKTSRPAPSLVFSGALRDDQKPFVKNLLKEIEKNDTVIGCAGTGTGKTSMALYIASVLKLKTLIIVHKEFLLNQWIERIQQFLPNASIGIMRQNKMELENDIVIGLLQSISMKDEWPASLFNDFGFIIVDETHHICSKTFSKALFKLGPKKILGLSATPERKDGLTKVLTLFMGEIIYKDAIENRIQTPKVKIIEAKFEKPLEPKTNFRGLTNIPDLINQIAADNERNRMIIKEILSARNRNIIVLSDRRNHCLLLKHMLDNSGFKGTSGVYLGAMTNKDLEETNKCDVIFATYSMASEGYDNPKLDTLIFATPKTDIEQSVGRILRRPNKNFPLIIDILDKEYRYGQYQSRKKFYRDRNFIICNDVKEVEKDRDIYTKKTTNINDILSYFE